MLNADVPASMDPRPSSRRMASLPMGAFLTALVGLGALSIDTFLPSLPAMMAELRSGAATAQLTITLFLAAFTTAQLLFGPLSDRTGRRGALVGGLCLFVGGAAASLFARSMPALVAARVVQGLGAGSGPVLARAVVRDVWPPQRAARVLSLMAIAQALTPILAPILGGFMQAHFGWRSVFLLVAALGAGFLIVAALAVEETAPGRGGGAKRDGPTLGGGVAALARDRAYVGFVLAVMLAFAGQFAFISGSAFVFMGLFGFSPRAYGFAFALVAFGLMTGSFLSVHHGARLGPEQMIRRGAALSAGAGLAMALPVAFGHASAVGILVPMYLFAVGAGVVMPNGMAGAIAPFAHMAGLASAVLGFAQMTGAAAYSVGVSRFLDGTARPMTFAIAASGLACFASALLLRRR